MQLNRFQVCDIIKKIDRVAVGDVTYSEWKLLPSRTDWDLQSSLWFSDRNGLIQFKI